MGIRGVFMRTYFKKLLLVGAILGVCGQVQGQMESVVLFQIIEEGNFEEFKENVEGFFYGPQLSERGVQSSRPGLARSVQQESLGILMNMMNANDETLLHAITRLGLRKFANFLLEIGFEVDILGPNDQTALHFAVDRGYPGMVGLFIDHGANVNAIDGDGNRPLHLALGEGRGDLYIIRRLVDKRADIYARQEGGNGLTSVHLLTQNQYTLQERHNPEAYWNALKIDGHDLSKFTDGLGRTPIDLMEMAYLKAVKDKIIQPRHSCDVFSSEDSPIDEFINVLFNEGQ